MIDPVTKPLHQSVTDAWMWLVILLIFLFGYATLERVRDRVYMTDCQKNHPVIDCRADLEHAVLP